MNKPFKKKQEQKKVNISKDKKIFDTVKSESKDSKTNLNMQTIKKPLLLKEKKIPDKIKEEMEEDMDNLEKQAIDLTKEDIKIEEKITDQLTQPIPIKNNDEDTENKNSIEALLFACGKYMDEVTISELCGIDKRKIRKILEKLREDYDSRKSALTISQEESSWKINVREKYISLVRKIVSDTELSRSIMETLAVIAWKSPIYQSEIVKIRGNKCYDHIEELENAGFVTKEKKGRSYVLKTTDKFFNYFDIDHGNLKGIFDTVKVPEAKAEQTTLDDVNKPVLGETASERINAIEIMKRTESDEEKTDQKNFLNLMDEKIAQVNARNKEYETLIPTPTMQDHGNIQPPIESTAENQPAFVTIEIKNPEVIDSPVTQIVEPKAETVQNAESKPKTLTKKQLEKKFRDELLRVRDKTEKKNA